MEDNRIFKGYWWLPSVPDDKVAGTLTIETDGDLRLELYGGFGQNENGVNFEREPDKVIYGWCYAPNGHMKQISLFECHSSISLNFSSDFPITRYTCYYALIGYHLLSMKDAKFFEARVEFAELSYWCPPSNITTWYKENSITIALDISTEKSTMASIKLNNGMTLSLNQECSYRPDGTQIDINQATTLVIEKDDISGLDVLATARKFERFLSLAMLKPIEHGRITLRSRDYYQEMKDGEPYYHSIELVSKLYKVESNDKAKMYDMLFNYADVKQDFEAVFKRYDENMSIAQIWSNLIDSLERKRVFTSNDFLVVIQALDGFSIRFRKETSFLAQIKALRDEFKDIKRLKLTDEDLKASKGSRDYYSHILKLEKKEMRNALEGAKLYDLTRKLRVLLICCILNFLGMDNGRINELLNKCRNSILRV